MTKSWKNSNIVKLILLPTSVFIAYNIWYYIKALPIASGYAAKIACSQVFIGKRDISDIIKNELNPFPQGLASAEINWEDKSATGSFYGFSPRKAIYREGLGCTLLSEITETELRKQKFDMPAANPSNLDNLPWPKGDKEEPAPKDIDLNKMNKAIERAFESEGTDPFVLKDSAAVVVVYDGKIIGEHYGTGQDKHTKHISWSMAKSVTSAILGVLVKQGKLNVNSPAPIAEWQNDDRKNITITNLLHMDTGLEWVEDYGGASSVSIMLHKKGDMAKYAVDYKLEDKIGKNFKYSSGTTNILNRVIHEAVGDNKYHRFAYEQFFNKIDMHNTVIEYDSSGVFVGSSYLFASARDYARFAMLFYQDGVWNNERILPEGWVEFSTTPSKSSGGGYGAQWWTNKGGFKDDPSGLYFPTLPADTYAAMGYGGQYIIIVPSKKLIVVRLSHAVDKLKRTNHQKHLGMDKLVTDIIDCLPK